MKDVRLKKLTTNEKQEYKLHHAHIAPEVVNGVETASIYSDIYAYAHMIERIQYYGNYSSPALKQIIKECLIEKHHLRASLSKVKDILEKN